jgi:hypothetical protein
MFCSVDCDLQVHAERQIARQGARHKHLGFGERSLDESVLSSLVEALQSPRELVLEGGDCLGHCFNEPTTNGLDAALDGIPLGDSA